MCIRDRTNALLVNYFKNELRVHYDFEWINLESLYWEDYTYEYTYYVPIRRKISPDWLVWQANGRRPVPDFSALQQRKYYTKYSVFLPANTNYSPSVQNVRTGTWNKNILNNVMQSPLSSIKKRSLWARIQHFKNYFKDSVPSYDDLLLKYDENDNPILHPLYSL